MSLFRRRREARAVTYQTVWGSGGDWPPPTDSGVRVDQSTALNTTTAWACVTLLADTVSTLPVGAFARRGTARVEAPSPPWLRQPHADDPSSTWEGHLAEVMFSLLLDGNAFVLTVRDRAGDVVEVRALDPLRVDPRRASGRIVYEVRTDDGGRQVLDGTMVRHLWRLRRPGALRGLSPVEAARVTIGKALATDAFGAAFFARGATLSGIVETPSPMDEAAAESLKDRFRSRFGGVRNAFDIGVLTSGATWKPLAITPEQGQFLETLQQGVEDVARVYRVPPGMVGSQQPGAASYASTAVYTVNFEKFTIRPYVECIESAYGALLAPGEFLRLDTRGLLRGDDKGRMEAYQIGLQNHIYTVNEVRALEDLPPLDGPDGGLLDTPNAPTGGDA